MGQVLAASMPSTGLSAESHLSQGATGNKRDQRTGFTRVGGKQWGHMGDGQDRHMGG